VRGAGARWRARETPPHVRGALTRGVEGDDAAGERLRATRWGARTHARLARQGPRASPAGEHAEAEAPHHGASLARGWCTRPGRWDLGLGRG
jgi:hypothetical protein